MSGVEQLQDVPVFHEQNLTKVIQQARTVIQQFTESDGRVELPSLEEILASNTELVELALGQTGNVYRGLLPGNRPGLLDRAEKAPFIGDGVGAIELYGSSSLAKGAMRAALDATILQRATETRTTGDGIRLIKQYGSSEVAKTAMRMAMDKTVLEAAQKAAERHHGDGVDIIKLYASSVLARSAMHSTLDGQHHPVAG